MKPDPDVTVFGEIEQARAAANGGGAAPAPDAPVSAAARRAALLEDLAFLEDLQTEIDTTLPLATPNPYLRMSLHLIRCHLEGRAVTPSALIGASGVPYATATRRLNEMTEAGLVEKRPRTRTGRSFSLHPSTRLVEAWSRTGGRVRRLAHRRAGAVSEDGRARDFYYGGSYMSGKSLPPPQVLPQPLTLAGGLRVLVHGDPTFMVMDKLKRQFEQLVGTTIGLRAFSIDRLRDEALRNLARRQSAYDIVAVDLPWIGEFAEKGVLLPLDEIMDVERLDPGDFHTAGWQAAHWGGRPYGVPSQTTPELLFYRRDLFGRAGLEPPETTDDLLAAAAALHDPGRGFYGIAWNAARGTALGHTFMMTCADFGHPIIALPEAAGGFDASGLRGVRPRPQLDGAGARRAAEFLLALMDHSPPDILSMSWYERVRPYAEGRIAMAYGYTLLAPYFELDAASPAHGNTGYLPHPAGEGGRPIAPVGGYVLGIPSNLAPERRADAVEALIAFTSPEAQKLYVQNGSRTAPRYSVGADADVRRLSPIFDAVDAMSWRDELQFWPRPPIPEITGIIRICGEELHDMLRGLVAPEDALARAQARAEELIAATHDQQGGTQWTPNA